MESAAQRCGAYGGEYMRAELCLHAQDGRRIDKISSQTRAKELERGTYTAATADQNQVVPSGYLAFYRRRLHTKTCKTSTSNVFLDRSAKLTSRVELTLAHDRSLDRIDRIGNRACSVRAYAAGLACEAHAACQHEQPLLFPFFFLFAFFFLLSC
jgi:hypothetical protein